MKRTPLKRAQPLPPGPPPKRRTPLRSQSSLHHAQLVRVATMRKNARSRGGASGQMLRKLDVVARRICMIRAGAMELEDTDSWVGKCEKCQRTMPLQWVHFITRAVLATRWRPENAMAACSSCHFGFMHKHNRSDPSDTTVARWWEHRIGSPAYAMLLIVKQLTPKTDYAALLIALELEARTLGDARYRTR